MSAPVAIYVHWPFCASKCPYCDFNSHVRETIDEKAWEQAYLTALDHYAEKMPGRRVVSVFFGGGTPSLMNPETTGAIIRKIHDLWLVEEGAEITLEANPTSVEREKFEAFYDAGINRVSLGVQSLNDDELKFLGREHSAKEALKAIDTARLIFDRYSFDLIYARPKQDIRSWRQELEKALNYSDAHMSLYQLTIERSTPFYMDHAQGKFSIPAEGEAADLYHETQDIMEAAGLPAYEISNHARPGEESRHNMVYWRYGDYIGIGPGAHGRLTIGGQKYATREHRAPEIWLEKVGKDGHAAHPFDPVAPKDRFMEGLMMGLRLREGLDLEKLAQVCGSSWEEMIDPARLEKAEDEGWMERKAAHVTLTREGWLRLNALIPYILKDLPAAA